jgi:hypothetical protein
MSARRQIPAPLRPPFLCPECWGNHYADCATCAPPSLKALRRARSRRLGAVLTRAALAVYDTLTTGVCLIITGAAVLLLWALLDGA